MVLLVLMVESVVCDSVFPQLAVNSRQIRVKVINKIVENLFIKVTPGFFYDLCAKVFLSRIMISHFLPIFKRGENFVWIRKLLVSCVISLTMQKKRRRCTSFY